MAIVLKQALILTIQIAIAVMPISRHWNVVKMRLPFVSNF